MSSYVDEDGNPVDVEGWMRLCRAGGVGRILAERHVATGAGDITVCTFWFGTVFPEVGIRPFGTAQAPTGTDQWFELEQYDTKQDALRGHLRWAYAISLPQPAADPGR